MEALNATEGFDWDDGNRDKNWIGHHVKASECEMVFFNQPLLVIDDVKHSESESRYYAYGKTDVDRKLQIVFCIRKNKIRVISARDMNKKEITFYENQLRRKSRILTMKMKRGPFGPRKAHWIILIKPR